MGINVNLSETEPRFRSGGRAQEPLTLGSEGSLTDLPRTVFTSQVRLESLTADMT